MAAKIEGIKERIYALMEYYHLAKTGFARKCGLDSGGFGRMLSGEQAITIRTVERISAAFPELNYDWLLNGTGTMLKTSGSLIHQAGDNNTAVGPNSTVNNSDALILAINELSAQRRVTEKAQQQIDRLITLLEKR